MNYNELNRFEFLLTLQNNIICQRNFPVRNFNPKAKNSLQISEYMKYMCNVISEDLKIKNAEYMFENKSQYETNENIEEVKEKQHYLLQLKLNDVTFNERIFPSNIYHPKVRLDVREYVKPFLNDLSSILSSRKPTTNFLNYQLNTL
jgi:hypothetical protein